MKIYIVKAPCGEYEDYDEPIVKVFLSKQKAKNYVAEENAKLPLEQAKKCFNCYFKWGCIGQKGKTPPNCFIASEDSYCQNYFKYRDVQELFMEEYDVEE